MTNFIDLSTEEKIDKIKLYNEDRRCSIDEEIVTKSYLMSLYNNDIHKIKEFESKAFSHGLRGIIENSVACKCAINLGYEPKYNKYGWVISHIATYQYNEIFDNEAYNRNEVKISRTPNNQFIYGITYNCVNGSCGGKALSIYSTSYSDFNDCLIAALESLIQNIKSCSGGVSSRDKAVINKIQKKLNDVKTPTLFNVNDL